MNDQSRMKQQLVKHLEGGRAFSPISTVLDNIRFEDLGERPNGLPYSFYELFAHIRISQLDILEYCTKDDYSAPEWPDDYWPDNPAPASAEAWKNLMDAYFRERKEFCDLILRPDTDLMNPLEANEDHNLLRQAELIIEHTAYHTGQLYVIYRLLDG